MIGFKHKSFDHYLVIFQKIFIFSSMLMLYVYGFKRINSIKYVYHFIFIFCVFIILLGFVNPINRVEAYHGYWHISLINELEITSSGFIENPFFAGENLSYPWGYYYIPLFLSKIFLISYSWAFVVINMLSFAMTAFLIYLIIRQIYKKTLHRNITFIICIMGCSVFVHKFVQIMKNNSSIVFETRHAPTFHKFLALNCMPVGIAFFMLFFYGLFGLNQAKLRVSNVLFLVLGYLGVAFFYPGLFFSVFVCLVASFLYWIILKRRYISTIILLLIISLVTILIKPYWDSISSGLNIHDMLTNYSLTLKKMLCLFTLLLPSIMFYLYSRRLGWKIIFDDNIIFIVINMVFLFGLYLFLSIPAMTEYKSLSGGFVLLGMIMGGAFASIYENKRRIAFVIIALYSLSSFSAINSRLWHCSDIDQNFKEVNGEVYPYEHEEAEMYSWIKSNTPLDSVWVSHDLRFPAFSKRKLYVWDGKWGIKGFSMDFVKDVCCIDEQLINERTALVAKIKKQIRGEALESDHVTVPEDIYIILENYQLDNPFFEELYISAKGKYRIYCLRENGY